MLTILYQFKDTRLHKKGSDAPSACSEPGGKQWQHNIGSGNDLVLLGDKPLPEPVTTKIYVNMWHHWATVSKRHTLYVISQYY